GESILAPLVVERFQGYLSALSFAHILTPRPTCLRLLTQAMRLAFALLAANAGRSRAARIAMIAITTNNSISVKASSVVSRLIISRSRSWSSESNANDSPHTLCVAYAVPTFPFGDGVNTPFRSI